MKLDQAVGNVIGDVDRRRTGVVVVAFPCSDGSLAKRSTLDFDDACRTEVRPGELLFTRPDYFDRLAGSPRETSGFDRCFRL
jgi:hypothetical protein